MNRFLIIIIILTAWSCKEISFREPQPKGKKALNSFPSELHGKFLPFENGAPSKDTIFIYASGYRLGSHDKPEINETNKDRFEEGRLNDSLILKSFQGYYFLNFREESEWLLRVVKLEQNGDLQFMSPQQKKDDNWNSYIQRLAEEIKIDSSEVDGRKIYIIDPSPKELVSLIEKGFFTKERLQRVK